MPTDMRVAGIILLVFAGLNLIAAFTGNISALNGVFMLGVLGAFLISRANKKKKEDNDKERWKNGE